MQIESLITEANQGYVNTHVYMRLVLHCIERYHGDEMAGGPDEEKKTTLFFFYEYKVTTAATATATATTTTTKKK